MNTRSIHFRLILWYSGLVVLVSLAFGAFTYKSLQTGLTTEMEQTLTRRAKQINKKFLHDVPMPSAKGFEDEIEAVYSPEVSSRFIRITRSDGSIFYISGKPEDELFTPASIPLPAPKPLTAAARQEPLASGFHLLVVALPEKMNDGTWLIEMGLPTDLIDAALHELLITLSFGLPIVVIIAAAGGFYLVRRSLKPVEDIRATAQQITFGNLSNRLPIAATGDALEHLSVTLNQMLDRLEDAYEQSSRFSADASHELRTPLTIMRGELESMTRETDIPAPLRERISSVLEETERLSRITESLFAISRLDAGEAKIQHVKFDLATLAQSTAEQMVLLAEEKKVGLHIQTPDPVSIYGDPARLKQIVVNLLDNAIKYTPDGGIVRLVVRAANHRALLEVIDNGAGIPADALPHLFERFYRADKVRSRELGGAGLGLSIVRSIVLAHGGTVDVESKEGEGTTCRVELPLANGQGQKA